MTSSLDQFIFISNVTAGKSSNVQSYVQSRSRKVKWHEKHSFETLSKRPSKHTTFPIKRTVQQTTHGSSEAIRRGSQRHVKETNHASDDVEDELEKLQALVMSKTSQLPFVSSSMITPDPFASTSLALPPFAWKFFQWPLSTFTTHVFRAESLDFRPASLFEKDFRHDVAVQQRLRLAVYDQLQMASTLLYSASVLTTWQGSSVDDRASQLFGLWTIQNLRDRLGVLSTDVSSNRARAEEIGWLVLAIHALTLSAMWAKNIETAVCHMDINSALIRRVGFETLDPYIREVILVGDKYLSLVRGQPPSVTPLHWKNPCPISDDQLPLPVINKGQCFGEELRDYLFGAGFHALHKICCDILHCVRVAASVQSQPHISGDVGSWIFMRQLTLSHQLIIHRADDPTEESYRSGMLVFLLLISVELGARARGRFQPTLDRISKLKIAAMARPDQKPKNPKLLLWTSVTLAFAAQRWGWDSESMYMDVISECAVRCDITATTAAIEGCLAGYLYLPKLQHASLVRLIESCRRKGKESY